MIRIHSFIETKTALADDWRAVRKTDLAPVSVAGQCQRNASGVRFVKMIGIVSQQNCPGLLTASTKLKTCVVFHRWTFAPDPIMSCRYMARPDNGRSGQEARGCNLESRTALNLPQ